MLTSNKLSNSSWYRIYFSLNRKAKVLGITGVILGLSLMGPVAPLSEGMVRGQASAQEEPVPHPVGWDHYEADVSTAASEYGIPADMFLRLLHVENPAGDPNAVSSAGAVGMGQFMPATAAIFKIDPRDPYASIDASARYLRDLHTKFRDWPHAVMSYNWGPSNVRRWLDAGGDGPIPAETEAYLSKIKP